MSKLDLLFEAVDLAASAHDPFPALAKALNKLQKVDIHAVKAFCKMTGMNSRKAYYLIEIDEYLGAFNIPPERMVKIGWTKLRLIGPHATGANLETLLERAENLTAKALAQFLAGLEPQAYSHCVQLYFTPLQHALFTKKLAQHGHKGTGSPRSREEALIAALLASS